MPKFVCEIDMDNAAFEDAPYDELESIVRRGIIRLCTRPQRTQQQVTLQDSNGNTVGYARIER